MSKYLCTDGNAEIEIEAESAEDAAQEYVDGGDWGDRSETSWIDVYVETAGNAATRDYVESHDDDDELDDSELTEVFTALYERAPDQSDRDTGLWSLIVAGVSERERITITLDAEEPECKDGEDHDWRSPYSVLGGIKENPGVWGHGGGVAIKEVCAHCGKYKITDTWAQRSDTGEQGLRSERYEDPDDASHEWLARRLRTRTLEVEIPDGYTADVVGDTNLYLARDDGERVLVTEDEQRAIIESASWDSIIEQMPAETDA
jgi:hypothetical protein